jgi:large subunit ribosomal protein L7/L12
MSAKNQKLIDEIGNMTVLELAGLVKSLEEQFGVSAAMPMMAGGAVASAGAAAAPAAEEKAEYKVTLQDAGSEKIKVLKALRSFMANLSLTDARKMTEETPCVIAEAVGKDEAMKMKKELEAAGAKVELS